MAARKRFPYVRQGENDLATLNPELVLEWADSNDRRPDEIAAGSHYNAWWKCSRCRWEWQAPVNMRSKAHHGCPACASKVKPKTKDFEGKTVPQAFEPAQPLPISRPDVMQYWDYDGNTGIDPMDLYCDSQRVVSWLCPVCGHKWRAKIYGKCRNGKCSSCVHRKRTLEKAKHDGIRILSELPEIAAMWSDKNRLRPSDFTVASHTVAWWRCPDCGTEWQGEIRNRVEGGSKCPLCHPTQKNVRKGENTVDVTDPKDVADWDYESNDPLTPADVTRSYARKVWWICSSCGYRYKESVSIHIHKFEKCPCCSNYKVVAGKNDLATLRPDLAAEWDHEANGDLTPSDVTAVSNTMVHWVCSRCGEKWIATPGSRNGDTESYTSCRVCRNHKTKVGWNDLATTNPELIEEWDREANDLEGWKPTEVRANQPIKAHWICKKCGYKWPAAISNRAGGGTGCPVCGMETLREKLRRRNVDMNNVGANSDLLSGLWSDKNELSPYDVSMGSSQLIWWKSEDCGHEWQATPHQMAKRPLCPTCYPAGRSAGEIELFSFVKSVCKRYGVDEIISNDRSLLSHVMSPDGREHVYELDVYVPDLKLAFEYNGDYWHSDESIVQSKPMFSSAEEYHELKETACAERCVQLFFVWEHEWLDSPAETRSRVEATIDSMAARLGVTPAPGDVG